MATRILNRHVYDGEDDIYVLAAAYLLAIASARGHFFNDANKRTAFASSALFLRRNGILLRFSPSHEEMTLAAAQGNIDVWNIANALKQST
jgi:death-on-curing protein